MRYSQVVLAVTSVVYIILAVWCSVDPEGTSASLGYKLTNTSARSEYTVVYGGLELDLGIFFGVCVFSKKMMFSGVFFVFVSFLCLASFRLFTILTLSDLTAIIYGLFATEILFTVLGLMGVIKLK